MEKRSFFSLRVHWGFILGLIVLLAFLFVFVSLYSMHWLFMDDIGVIMPTKYMADQVGSELWMDLSEELRGPSEIQRWRSQGYWDAEPEFSKAALFWFTYNSTEHSFNIRPTTEDFNTPPDLIDHLKSKIASIIDSTLSQKQAGGIPAYFKDETGDYNLQGLLYKEEPKAVGLITDLNKFRQIVLPEVLEHAKDNFPLLKLFTEGVGRGEPFHSSMFILYRNSQDSIIAQLGSPGEYAYDKELGSNDYMKEYPLWKAMDIKPEIVLPHCFDLRWEKAARKGFYGIIALLVIVLLLWIRAEIRLKRAKSYT